MRTASSSYNTYNALAYKKPVFAVEFSGINTKFVSDVFADILSPPMGVTYKKYLKNVRFNQGELDIFTPSYISGTYVVSIVDIDDEVISFLNSASIFDLTVTIKLGFQEIDYDDFVNLTTGGARVKDYYLNSDLLTWDIQCRDGLIDLLDKNIGTNDSDVIVVDSFLSTNFTVSDTVIDVNDTAVYGVLADLTNNLDNRVFPVVKIDSEIFRYDTSGGGNLTTITPALGNTAAANHTAALTTTVKKGLGFSCDPCRIFLHLSMSTTAGTNGRYDFDSDINFSGSGGNPKLLEIGLTSSQVNIESIERLGWRLFNYVEYNTIPYRFYFAAEQFNFLDHVQNILLKPHGLFLMIRDGKIDIGSNDYLNFFENFSADDTFDSGIIESVNSLGHNTFDEVVSNARVFYNFNHATEDFNAYRDITHNSNADTFYPSAKSISINHYGLDNTDYDVDLVTHWLEYRFLTFADIATIININSNHQTALLEVGDTPDITLSQLPNENTGARGWTNVKTFLVGQDFDLLNNTFRHTLRVFAMPNFVENEITSYYTVNKVVEGSIDDKALTVSTDETATTEAADAYYDNSGTNYDADLIIFFIRVTPPAYGSGSTNEIINLKISWLDNVPAIQNYDYRPYIAFNPQSSEAFTVALYLYGANASADTPDSVKVDWISTTATGSEIPTVEFVGVWFCVCNL